jgi:hypothetical protein
MPDIQKKQIKNGLQGEQLIQVANGSSLHTLYFSGATGDITITVVPYGFDSSTNRVNPGAESENIVSENGMIQLDAGAIDYVVVTPTVTNVDYSVSVSSQ